MIVQGIGVVFAGGRGVDAYCGALRNAQSPSSAVFVPFQDGDMTLFQVPDEALKDKTLLRGLRRADRLSRMAVVAAHDAIVDNDSRVVAEETGVILATAFGPHCSTFRFLDEISEYGDDQVSPTLFSHTVHNAAASYVAATLQLRGPTLTLTDFAFGFQHALLLARQWLDAGRCRHVLVGCADELGTIMEYVCTQKLNLAPDGRIQPFLFSGKPEAVPGEGSLFMLLGDKEEENSYARVAGLQFKVQSEQEQAPVTLLENDGLTSDESAYLRLLEPESALCGFAPVFGSFPSSGGFHCAAAALMIAGRECFPSPSSANPHDLKIADQELNRDFQCLASLRLNCAGKCARTILKPI